MTAKKRPVRKPRAPKRREERENASGHRASRGARPYAQALFDLAREEGRLEAILSGFDDWHDLLETHPLLKKTLENPTLPVSERAALLDKLLKKGRTPPLFQKAMRFLLEKRRFHFLSAIAQIFEELLAKEKGERILRLSTAEPLSRAARQDMHHLFRKRFGENLKIVEALEPSLLGGFRVELGNLMLDASLSNKMNRLRDSIE